MAPPAAAQVCVACHGENGASTNPVYPILAGQTMRYIYLQLKDFKEGRRADPQMSPMAANLSKEDMLALATYFSEQAPPHNDFAADAEKAARGKQRADDTLCTMCHLGSYQGQNEIPLLPVPAGGRPVNSASSVTTTSRNSSRRSRPRPAPTMPAT